MLVVVKPSRAKSTSAHIAWLKTQIACKKISCDWFYTSGHYELDVEKLRTLMCRHDLLVAIGGDGTINIAVNAIVGLDCQLAILPAGTGNDFTRQFKRTTKQWRQSLFLDRTRSIDVGQVNQRYFINVMGLGYSAYVVKKIERNETRHRFRYLWAGLSALLSYEGIIVQSAIDKTPQALMMLLFANGQYFAAGVCCSSNASPDDGLLRCIQFSPKTRWERVKVFLSMLFARHKKQPSVYSRNLTRFDIITPGLDIEADGEIIGKTPAQVSILHSAISLRV
ncbi:Diacylglycerol kinase [Pseudoalteromonas holothuriae]|uniref:Diacylglycerol kinase n=1 Tax=Pseudoalteromonas holothuriae TaxID=2963714 RepID=A0A9W4W2V8_9GAMM|nr:MULTISPECIES: diacylglycerol kinase family protein [unclassified Pseudoalteromonas]CAH9065386.1 Diacylglycerol kinase [Pseudoalteromonas sp. CIP111854]CAH9067062.1 Diacylglycerol kinase [Pseudoalteromonas sp. CIP111951]